MTAAEAVLDPSVRDAIATAANASDRAVVDHLRGYPPSGRLGSRLLHAIAAAGVDCRTIPKRTPDELAAHREARRPKCRRCRELEARIAELEARTDPKSTQSLRVVS